MANPTSRQASPLCPSGGTTGQLFSSPSLLQDDIHKSILSPCERPFPNSQIIYQSRNEKSLPSHSEEQSTALVIYKGEDIKNIPPWCADPVSDFFDFSDIVSVQNGQMESGVGIMTSAQNTGKTNWSDWDPLISNEDALGTFWNDLPDDVSA